MSEMKKKTAVREERLQKAEKQTQIKQDTRRSTATHGKIVKVRRPAAVADNPHFVRVAALLGVAGKVRRVLLALFLAPPDHVRTVPVGGRRAQKRKRQRGAAQGASHRARNGTTLPPPPRHTFPCRPRPT